ncbi:phage integrase [Bartonella henselae]|uniref:Phage integrase n=1 Tax=Bartonella henselae TaxID=38323 RepID=X5MI32_BARHN|nr:phage integrase [Bartonella henselae]
MGLSALTDVSLKKARELATQWHSVLHKGCDLLKERDK